MPKPGKSGELDAWLLGTTFDARNLQAQGAGLAEPVVPHVPARQ